MPSAFSARAAAGCTRLGRPLRSFDRAGATGATRWAGACRQLVAARVTSAARGLAERTSEPGATVGAVDGSLLGRHCGAGRIPTEAQRGRAAATSFTETASAVGSTSEPPSRGGQFGLDSGGLLPPHD